MLFHIQNLTCASPIFASLLNTFVLQLLSSGDSSEAGRRVFGENQKFLFIFFRRHC